MITIVVRGDPEGLAAVHQFDGLGLPEKVAVAFYGRHQHFDYTGEAQVVEGFRLPVYRFTYSTAIAE